VNYLLDTNVISELVAREPEAQVLRWVDAVDPASLFLSVITIGEIQKGISRLAETRRRDELTSWLQQDLLGRFRDHILAIDSATMLTWGSLTADLEKKGQPMPAIDSLLAATAAAYGMTLVTHNTGDFIAAGIRLLNPWTRETD